MAHQRFDADIDELSDEFDAAAEIMLKVVQRYAQGAMSAPDAEEAIEITGTELKATALAWTDATVPAAYRDGIEEALEVGGSDIELTPDDHETMLSLSQRRLERRLSHAADGLVVDALDTLDGLVESRLAPLKTDGAEP